MSNLTRLEAEARVLDFEHSLEQLVSDVSPEELIPELARRLRQAENGMVVRTQYPHHAVAHAIESCCAYWRPYKYKPLNEQKIHSIISHIARFDDPALLNSLRVDSDLFEFLCYMHRTQLEKQGSLWAVPVGRAIRMFQNSKRMPQLSRSFKERNGFSIDEWLKAAIAVIAINESGRSSCGSAYMSKLTQVKLSSVMLNSFLASVSDVPATIGMEYRKLRGSNQFGGGPLSWLQRRSVLAERPLIKLARGYTMPIRSYVTGLLDEMLVNRMVVEQTDAVRSELGQVYQAYVGEVLSKHFASASVLDEQALGVVAKSRMCDFAIQFNDIIILIECKAVSVETKLVTKNAILNSNAISKIVSGFDQIRNTAELIKNGVMARLGLRAGAPVVGFVATMGEVPAANHPAVWRFACDKMAASWSDQWPDNIVFRPQVLSGVSFEECVLAVASKLVDVVEEVRSLSDRHDLELVRWERVFGDRCRQAGGADVGYWRAASAELLERMGVPRTEEDD